MTIWFLVGDGEFLFEETFELKVIQSRITYWIFDFTRPLTHSVTKEIFHVARENKTMMKETLIFFEKKINSLDAGCQLVPNSLFSILKDKKRKSQNWIA